MSSDALHARLRAALGRDAVRDSVTTTDDFHGPTLTLVPRDGDGVARALRESAAAGISLAVRGAGTKPGLAAVALGRAGAVLSTSRLDAIDVVDGDEGVARAGAGVSVASLRDRVDAAGWLLPLDPASLDATLGGVLAAAETGPRLRGFGRPRDIVLGLGVTLASGERTRCGGRVVKNVTGYDLAKLWTGSCGSLGVIEDAWLRLRPRPESTALVFRAVAHATEGVARARFAADMPLARAVLLIESSMVARILGTDAFPSNRPVAGAGLVLLVELAGPEDLVRRAAALLAAESDAVTPHGVTLDAVRAWIDAMSRGSELGLRFSCAPSRAACVIESMRAAGASVLAHPEVALVIARFPAPQSGVQAAFVADAVRATGQLARGGMRIDAGSRTGLGAATPPGALVPPAEQRVAEILRALKQRFDPHRALAAPVPGLEDEPGPLLPSDGLAGASPGIAASRQRARDDDDRAGTS